MEHAVYCADAFRKQNVRLNPVAAAGVARCPFVMWPKIIETRRLILRIVEPADAPAIFHAYATDPEVTKHLVWRPHRAIEETYAFIGSCMKDVETGSRVAYAIVRRDSDQLIGMIDARSHEHNIGIGYVLARSAWNHGYMTEALRAVIEQGLSRPEIWRIYAVCDIDNPASARVMEKAGMLREGLLRKHSVAPNISDMPRDVYIYAIVRE